MRLAVPSAELTRERDEVAFMFIHVLLMFGAVAMAAGSSFLLLVAARRRELEAIRAITAVPITRIVPVLYIGGAVFGLATALALGYDLRSAWLVIAYVLFALLAAFGLFRSGPLVERLNAVLTDPGAARPDETERLLDALGPDTAVNLVGIALIIADMVFKPFFS